MRDSPTEIEALLRKQNTALQQIVLKMLKSHPDPDLLQAYINAMSLLPETVASVSTQPSEVSRQEQAEAVPSSVIKDTRDEPGQVESETAPGHEIPLDKNSPKWHHVVKKFNAAQASPLVENPKNLKLRGIYASDEQQHGIDLSATAPSLKIHAGAGSGKSSNLAMISQDKHQSGQRGLYITFNRQNALDAAKVMSRSTTCKNAHSLAFGAVGHRYQNAGKMKDRLTSRALIRELGLRPYGDIDADLLAGCISDWISRFCNSVHTEVNMKTAPVTKLIALTKKKNKAEAAAHAGKIAEYLLPHVVKTWQRMTDLTDPLPINPDVYLKLWVMSNPRLPYDYIMFDECQDASGVMIQLVAEQKDAQQIWVGDKHQQIYAWRYAVNAMEKINTTHESELTRSFRYGESIAQVANAILSNHLQEKDFVIKGNPNVPSLIGSIETPKAFISRTNKALISKAINAISQGKRICIAGGVDELCREIEAAECLMNGIPTRHSSYSHFRDWHEVIEYSESEMGSEYRAMVSILNNWRPRYLIAKLDAVRHISEDEADTIFTTAHKAKGREFDTVTLGDDFNYPLPDDPESYNPEDGRLLYVAATRAKKVVDITNCTAVIDALDLCSLDTKKKSKHEKESLQP